MADVFISYAKADRPLALKLAAMLEAEGWKVWWDTSLAIGDDFRNEIMTELGRARAVVVIWTDASVKSDWVRSEAGRGQGKLIPVKLEHLTYKDLPPPFDVLHTENVSEDDKIRAAVVAQLAKPAVEPSAVALLTKGFKYEVLTWVGIVGGALTLFANLGAVLKLADWARVLVQHWKEWTHAFWVWAFGWLGIHVPPDWAPVLSFLFFGFLTVGRSFGTFSGGWFVNRYKFRAPLKVAFVLSIVTGVMAVIWSVFLMIYDFYFVPYLFAPSIMVPMTICYMAAILLFSRYRLHSAITLGLMLLFFIVIAY